MDLGSDLSKGHWDHIVTCGSVDLHNPHNYASWVVVVVPIDFSSDWDPDPNFHLVVPLALDEQNEWVEVDPKSVSAEYSSVVEGDALDWKYKTAEDPWDCDAAGFVIVEHWAKCASSAGFETAVEPNAGCRLANREASHSWH